jgi:hypothetical protein
MSTVLDQIHRFEKEANEKQQEADRLRKLLAAYPDLEVIGGRWKTVYASKSVNTKVTKCDLDHSCGCCRDAALEAWFFLETPNGRVYSKPPRFTVGEQHFISGDVATRGWKKGLRDAEIPEALIQVVVDHFKEDAEERVECASLYEYEDED